MIVEIVEQLIIKIDVLIAHIFNPITEAGFKYG